MCATFVSSTHICKSSLFCHTLPQVFQGKMCENSWIQVDTGIWDNLWQANPLPENVWTSPEKHNILYDTECSKIHVFFFLSWIFTGFPQVSDTHYHTLYYLSESTGFPHVLDKHTRTYESKWFLTCEIKNNTVLLCVFMCVFLCVSPMILVDHSWRSPNGFLKEYLIQFMKNYLLVNLPKIYKLPKEYSFFPPILLNCLQWW